MNTGHPLLIVVAGPSGTGKSTLCKRLLAEFPQIRYSVSCTTREPRGEEKDGVAYHFISRGEFKEKIAAGEFLEHAEVHGNFYGTLKSAVEGVLERGGSVLMDIDVAGAAQVRGKVRTLPQGDLMREGFRDVFVDAPSVLELRRRLEKRGEDSSDTIWRRLENARKEIERSGEFAFRIVNDDLDRAYSEFREIIMWGTQSGFKHKFPGKKLILLDLDGTVYAGNAAVPGAAEFVRKCGERGVRCVYVTNRSNRTPAEVRNQLVGMGIECEEKDIVTT
ncbi:MAG: guanylate kinase, partial [Kiritimatiellaeota bacterium]|nr:guanylate kinase [Kiritimatiellota bacterium]